MKQIETYKGAINEYVDWISGKNVLTDEQVTNLPISGESIRTLLQDHLKKPIYFWHDTANAKYKIFSSTESYQLYKDNPEEREDLVLTEFSAPSAYFFDIQGLTADTKFVRSGDPTQQNAKIEYVWYVKNDLGNKPDSITATYTIFNPVKGTKQYSIIYNSDQNNVSENIYEYLAEGDNTVTVTLKSNHYDAELRQSYKIIMLKLQLSSLGFEWYKAIKPNDTTIIQIKLDRNNNSYTTTTYMYIDGQQYASSVAQPNTDMSPTYTFSLSEGLSEGLHTIQFHSVMLINNSQFWSNLVYFNCVVEKKEADLDKYLLFNTSFDETIDRYEHNTFTLKATQYEKFDLDWAYYTNSTLQNTTLGIQFLIKDEDSKGKADYTVLTTMLGTKNVKSDTLSFIPSIYTQSDHNTYLVAYDTLNQQEIVSLPIMIQKNAIVVNEVTGYALKLSAFGRSNSSDDKDLWGYNNIVTRFNNIEWSGNNGWYNNSFRTRGVDSYAIIPFNPFATSPDIATMGRTIEIEFESENINSNDDAIITIGCTQGGHIIITPNSATLYQKDGDTGKIKVVKTNFKSNERVKLAFILNREDTNSQYSNLACIVNNGILERAFSISRAQLSTNSTDSVIKIGGTESGVKVYNIRCYNYALTVQLEFDNYCYDNENKAKIVNNNNILSAGAINSELVQNKIDTIIISGDLDKLLQKETNKTDSTTAVDIERICPFDESKSFKLTNGKIRKHGQSTLNYPVPSFKIWTNSSITGTPTFHPAQQQLDLNLAKNRYVMKDGAIPSNKFVLQANYADSSGVHNGGFERLIQNTWFNAVIDGEYKLRTPPLLFTTNTHITTFGSEKSVVNGYNKEGKLWRDYFSGDFPYDIRVSPDSFPCTVFYQNKDASPVFLGQYVFMDDKKSDYIYGERSIYKVNKNDPFCISTTYLKLDTDENKIWDNKDVLRMEVLEINNNFVSYMADNINGLKYDAIVDSVDDDSKQPIKKYKWEESFEMIYPDPDDVEEEVEKDIEKGKKDGTYRKFGENSVFKAKTKPFLDFFTWLISTKDNHDKFRREAKDHLDLYKIAAYYVFLFRFGLVDSLERNAQLKTYDGQHWWYEPWDMDIALGNKNTGGIAFNPPIDRNTTLDDDPLTYAYSGKSNDTDKNSTNYGKQATSNWLFDALEAWTSKRDSNGIVIEEGWIDSIVPKVSQALYTAGLNYDNIIKELDQNYAEKWCETIYNKSGEYKYIESRGTDNSWLEWLQGSRTTHRHWWLKTSMDYWDAKWGVGDFNNHAIYIAANHTQGVHGVITITPNTQTFTKVTLNDENDLGSQEISKTRPGEYDITNIAISTKTPFKIYGANFIEELDLSALASSLDVITLSAAYSNELGSNIKTLNIGVPVTRETNDKYSGGINALSCNIAATNADKKDALESLQILNMRGQRGNGMLNMYDFMRTTDRSNVTDIYAMGSNIIQFGSSNTGNKFNTLELPTTVTSFDMKDSSWENLSFWLTTLGAPIMGKPTDEDGNEIEGDDVVVGYTSNIFDRYTISGIDCAIPNNLTSVTFEGTTASKECSKKFVLDWIASMKHNNVEISSRSFKAKNIHWTGLTYELLEDIAKFNEGHNTLEDGTLSGYILLNGSDITPQRLANIISWFGDTAFTLNSSGLVIDYDLDKIQVSVGNDAYLKDGEIWLDEGKEALLQASKFKLTPMDETPTWFVCAVDSDSGKTQYNSLYIKENLSTGNIYLASRESTYENYTAKLYCVYLNSERSDLIIIHVNTVNYPVFNVYSSNRDVRKENDTFIFSDSNQRSELYLLADREDYTATIKDVTYRLVNKELEVDVVFSNNDFRQNRLNNIIYPIKLGNDTILTNSNIGYGINADNTYKYSAVFGSMTLLGICKYELTVTIKYANIETSLKYYILLIKDEPIVLDFRSVLYRILQDKYKDQYGLNHNTYFYISTLLNFNGSFDVNKYSSQYGNYLMSDIKDITADTQESIFKYLPNITQINLSGASNLTNEAYDVQNINLNDITGLTTLNLSGCEKLSISLDVNKSRCPELLNLYTKNSQINVTALDSKLRNLELGRPTTISLQSNNNLRSFTLQDGSNVLTFIYTDNRTNNGFATLGKIILDQLTV